MDFTAIGCQERGKALSLESSELFSDLRYSLWWGLNLEPGSACLPIQVPDMVGKNYPLDCAC